MIRKNGLHRYISIVASTFICLTTSMAEQSSADERILSYHSHITVHEDSSMTVRETIKVRSEGKKIKRGIYRDFPTRYKDHLGNRYVVDFKVREVLRDGKPEAYHTESLSNGTRVKMGKKDVRLPPGEYTYAITYETNRQLGFFEDHDELYWNVTGNDWEFPIEEASATLELPEGISRSSLTLQGYTGPEGSTAGNLMISVDDYEYPAFHTTKPLKSLEGLTIVAAWPKGFVEPPSRAEKFGYFVRDNLGAGVGGLGVLVILGYYLVTWAMAGKDPTGGTIIPLYRPPEGFSPAAMRYIFKMGYDSKAFTAALINMAVKGFITIREEDGVYTVVKERAETKGLSPEEKKIAARLLKPRLKSEVELQKKNHSRIGKAVVALKKSLKLQYETKYFVTNKKYFIPGLVLSIVVILAAAVCAGIAGNAPAVLFMCAWLTGWSVGVVFLLFAVISAWKSVFQWSGGRLQHLGVAIPITLFALPFLAGEAFGIWFLISHSTPLLIPLMLAIVFINCLFYHLLKAPTRAGRMLLDKIEGFRMYLGVAEKERLDLLSSQKKTPELFERYLPYALALDLENRWSEKFADVLARAREDGTEYRPVWYSGTSWSSARPGTFASSLGGTFSSAISSSSTAPGSSSGLGGGGFSGGGGGSSGGGGGGGGGGGW
ncbi:MAG: DUF2207 domain-containing protein [Candidatus Tritonobacter lacicola]|nr:DUF2207 domain-containing protein [Candidatus Tritonobacter lacicola]